MFSTPISRIRYDMDEGIDNSIVVAVMQVEETEEGSAT